MLIDPISIIYSTLLDMIANRKLSGRWSGEILMNGRRRGRWFNRDVSYVLQDDIRLPTLTVEVCTRLPFLLFKAIFL